MSFNYLITDKADKSTDPIYNTNTLNYLTTDNNINNLKKTQNTHNTQNTQGPIQLTTEKSSETIKDKIKLKSIQNKDKSEKSLEIVFNYLKTEHTEQSSETNFKKHKNSKSIDLNINFKNNDMSSFFKIKNNICSNFFNKTGGEAINKLFNNNQSLKSQVFKELNKQSSYNQSFPIISKKLFTEENIDLNKLKNRFNRKSQQIFKTESTTPKIVYFEKLEREKTKENLNNIGIKEKVVGVNNKENTMQNTSSIKQNIKLFKKQSSKQPAKLTKIIKSNKSINKSKSKRKKQLKTSNSDPCIRTKYDGYFNQTNYNYNDRKNNNIINNSNSNSDYEDSSLDLFDSKKINAIVFNNTNQNSNKNKLTNSSTNTIMKYLNNKNNDKDIYNKSFFCPFCEHCNINNKITNEIKDYEVAVTEAKNIINRTTEFIVNSDYFNRDHMNLFINNEEHEIEMSVKVIKLINV